MADEKIMKQAQSVYETLCKTLTARDWNYTRHDDDLTITCGARGEDLPMDIIIAVRPGPQVVALYSPMPFKIAEDKRVDAALAVCIANYGLINGTFDYNIADGQIRFRMVSSYRESILGEELFNYMLLVSANTIDDYNDKFLMVSKGMMTIEQFIESEKQNNS
ncbi:MAG: hypothetical protein IKD04_07160 [Clostridia bacterium]|nr:hypothetical protein [Clostridia bacterium]